MGDVAPKLHPVGRQNRWLVLGTCHFQECGKIVPELIQTVPLTPKCSCLKSKNSWLTKSKAFFKSINTAPVII